MDKMPTRVLIIDDDPGRHSLLPVGRATEFVVRHPLDVEVEDLHDVDLVCVDEYLGSDWALEVNERVSGLPTLTNNDGLAVAAALRSRARLAAQDGETGFAVALFTAELGKLAQETPYSRQEPLTASLHDLEWVFRFDNGLSPLGERIGELSEAARMLSRIDVSTSGDLWLGLSDQPWAELSRAQIDDCRPPEHALARSTSGRSYLRWFTQRILPYPTFLLDDLYAANLLGLDKASFSSLALQDLLATHGAKYGGAVSTAFLGRRWWRAALQQLLEEVGSSQWDSPAQKTAALGGKLRTDLKSLTAVSPVVTYGADGELFNPDSESEHAVRIQMDGWPVFADEAWAELDSVRSDPALRALVAHDDLDQVDA